MKICAITMVYRDYWALSEWHAHYSRSIGAENLFVVSHGADPRIAEICHGSNIIVIPRDDLAGFDRKRGQMLNSFQDGLGIVYDWVIRTDADELICLDPSRYASFHDLFEAHSSDCALFALGLNLIEAATDGVVTSEGSIFDHRSNAVFSGHYSKAFAVRRGTHLARHGIISKLPGSFRLPEGVFLVHLKYANIDALQEANRHRIAIASRDEPGLPGQAWKQAKRDARRFYAAFERMDVVDWNAAHDDAYSKVSREPETQADKGVVRAKSIKFETRTILPEWFKTR